jgi:predicted ester cyclase
MNRDINETILNRHLEAEIAHDMEGTLATLHPECVFLDLPLGLRLEGRDGARRHYELWWSAFSNTLDRAGRHWVHDDLMIAEAAFVGQHTGSFAGLAPTHRPIHLPFVVFVTFRDGLLAGERFIYDLNDLMRQLGQAAFEPELDLARA